MTVSAMTEHLFTSFGDMSDASPMDIARSLAQWVNSNSPSIEHIEAAILRVAFMYAPDDQSYYGVIRECFWELKPVRDGGIKIS